MLTSVQQCESVLNNHTHAASETVTRHRPVAARCGRAHTFELNNMEIFQEETNGFSFFPRVQVLDSKFPLVVEIFSTTAVLTFEKEILFVVHW